MIQVKRDATFVLVACISYRLLLPSSHKPEVLWFRDVSSAEIDPLRAIGPSPCAFAVRLYRPERIQSCALITRRVAGFSREPLAKLNVFGLNLVRQPDTGSHSLCPVKTGTSFHVFLNAVAIDPERRNRSKSPLRRNDGPASKKGRNRPVHRRSAYRRLRLFSWNKLVSRETC